MRIKTEVGTTILIICGILFIVTIVVGQNKLSADLSVIEKSVKGNKESLVK
jgi:hypothetical protein